MTNDGDPNAQMTKADSSSFGFRHSFVICHSSFVIHSLANRVAARLMKLLFGYSSRIHVIGRDNANCAGGFLLASNHISHFDPFILSAVVRRKIDWMTMAEFFRHPILGVLLRAVDAFPAERHRADRKTIRTAIERLKRGHVVGLFPEGGIRDGTRSLLEGAPLRPGAATLAHMAGVPIVPGVIVGSDRLYEKKNWLPFRRTPVWIAFGQPIAAACNFEKFAARKRVEQDLADAFMNLYSDLQRRFQLTPDDLPHSPQERMRCSRPAQSGRPGKDTATERRGYNRLGRYTASAVDFAMCASMNLLQARHRLHSRSREEMEQYVIACEKLTAQSYYAAPNDVDLANAVRQIRSNGEFPTGSNAIRDSRIPSIRWSSPVKSSFPANDIARVDLFPCARGWRAPTVLMLHALMSATRIGYRRCAARFNEIGWNACFVHLPYHYSRVPRGYWNGELAITANLVRNAEGLRQGVMEVRQLMSALRARGCSEFGILGTSYGGWIGALLAMVERDFKFVALMAPITNVEHAIWESPASAMMRRELRRANVDPALIARHFHLSSPMHNQPLCDAERILFVAGDFDSIARRADIETIRDKWRGSELLTVRQGHFGYRMMRETLARLKSRL